MSFFRNTEKARLYFKAIEAFDVGAFADAYLSQLFNKNAQDSLSIYLYQKAKNYVKSHHEGLPIQDQQEVIDCIHEAVLRNNPDLLHPPKL